MNSLNIDAAREQMIYHQIRPWDVINKRILNTLGRVQREQFVPEQYKQLAFSDCEIPLACGQNMLKPVLEGRLLQALDTADDQSVLVVGTGSGYLTACVAALADNVTSIDIHAELTDSAAVKLADEKVRNVETLTADVNEYTPKTSWDRILLTGSMPLFDARIPEWLNDGGKALMVVGSAPNMSLEEVIRNGAHYSRTKLFETVVRPLENTPQPSGFQL